MKTIRPLSQIQQSALTYEERRNLIPSIAPEIDSIIEPSVAQTLLKNEKFMVAVDSYRLGRCSMMQAMHMAFESPPFFPEGTDIFAFSNFVINTAKTIIDGDVRISAKLRAKYKHFYNQQYISPEDI